MLNIFDCPESLVNIFMNSWVLYLRPWVNVWMVHSTRVGWQPYTMGSYTRFLGGHTHLETQTAQDKVTKLIFYPNLFSIGKIFNFKFFLWRSLANLFWKEPPNQNNKYYAPNILWGENVTIYGLVCLLWTQSSPRLYYGIFATSFSFGLVFSCFGFGS